jgi:hypothetical protein
VNLGSEASILKAFPPELLPTVIGNAREVTKQQFDLQAKQFDFQDKQLQRVHDAQEAERKRQHERALAQDATDQSRWGRLFWLVVGCVAVVSVLAGTLVLAGHPEDAKILVMTGLGFAAGFATGKRQKSAESEAK